MGTWTIFEILIEKNLALDLEKVRRPCCYSIIWCQSIRAAAYSESCVWVAFNKDFARRRGNETKVHFCNHFNSGEILKYFIPLLADSERAYYYNLKRMQSIFVVCTYGTWLEYYYNIYRRCELWFSSLSFDNNLVSRYSYTLLTWYVHGVNSVLEKLNLAYFAYISDYIIYPTILCCITI